MFNHIPLYIQAVSFDRSALSKALDWSKGLRLKGPLSLGKQEVSPGQAATSPTQADLERCELGVAIPSDTLLSASVSSC